MSFGMCVCVCLNVSEDFLLFCCSHASLASFKVEKENRDNTDIYTDILSTRETEQECVF